MRFDGKSNKQRAKSFKLTELSGVTTPAHTGANVTFFKAATDGSAQYAYKPKEGEPKLRIDDAKHVGAAVAALGPKGFRGNKAQIPEADLPGVIARVRAAWRKFHPDMTDEDMPEVLRKFSDMFKSDFAEAIAEEEARRNISLQMHAVWDTIWLNECALREAVQSAAEDGNPIKPILAEYVMSLAQSLLTTEDDAMSAELQKQVDDLKADLATQTALAGMSDAQKAHYGTLDAAGKATFIVLDDVSRSAMVSAAKAADETVTINGAEIKKSAVGQATFDILKAQQTTIAKQLEDAAVAKYSDLAKSAEFSLLPGEVVAKSAALRAVDSLPEVQKTAVLAMLKSGNEALKSRHTAAGARVDLDGMSATDKFNSVVKARAEKDGITEAVATTKVLETPEGAELYARMEQGE